MPEIRHDAISGRSVIVATERASRPHTVASAAAIAEPTDCPFCANNEGMTPPEVARTGQGSPDAPGWRVRTVPNLYPIVEPSSTAASGATGAHEVVVLSPDHLADFGRLDDTTAIDALLMMRDRVKYHLSAGRAFAFAFINHGRIAGASIAHPHAQVVALDVVPEAVVDMAARFDTIDLIAQELAVARDNDLVVIDGDAPAWSPPASPNSFGLRVAHLTARSQFSDATDEEIGAVALSICDSLARLSDALGNPAYNVVLHTAWPTCVPNYMHWHAELIPRLGHHAGLEFGTGMFVNVVAPEDAATILRSGRT